MSEQYEVYPYPERDPADEARRLIVGSPSFPVEIDHYLFGGRRDWSRPIRILVAGGGTGDALVQMAQILTDAGRPYEITYLDLSGAARKIAEARLAARGLGGVAFHTASLTEAPRYGAFDYVDCCGVLHHLPDPDAGARALAEALAPGGGIGLMVYAPLGRSGVYPLQAAFNALWGDATPERRLAHARAVMAGLPGGHPFSSNPHLVDHRQSDAGFYDLLLHASDRPYSVPQLEALLSGAGLRLSSFVPPALYDLDRLLPEGVPVSDTLSPVGRMAAAENLRGTMKTHIAYVTRAADDPVPPARGDDPAAVPHLKSVAGPALARSVAAKGAVRLTIGGQKIGLALPRESAPLIARIDGSTPLGAIQRAAGLDLFAFRARWARIHAALAGWGELLYSRLYR